MKNIYLLFTILLFSIQSMAEEKKTLSIIAPASVNIDEAFTLKLNINIDVNNKKIEGFESVNFQGFEILMGPALSASNTQFTTADEVQESIITSYTYVLKPIKTGTFAIPSIKLKIDNEEFSSKSTTIRVESKSAPITQKALADKDFFVKAEVSNHEVKTGSKVVVTYSLYWKNAEVINEKHIKPQFADFRVVEIDKELKTKVIYYDGINYYTCQLYEFELYPKRTGEFEIEPMKFLFTVCKDKEGDTFKTFFEEKEKDEPFEWEVESNKIKIKVTDKTIPTHWNS